MTFKCSDNFFKAILFSSPDISPPSMAPFRNRPMSLLVKKNNMMVETISVLNCTVVYLCSHFTGVKKIRIRFPFMFMLWANFGISLLGNDDFFPFPPVIIIPWFCRSIECWRTPVTTVVNPEECQSKPRTHPNDWNYSGSASLFRNSAVPCSAIKIFDIENASFFILSKRYCGGCP